MSTDISTVVFAVIIVVLFDIVALASERWGWSFLGTMVSLVFTAYLAAGDGLIVTHSFLSSTNTVVHDTTSAYPFYIIGFLMMTLMSVILTMGFVTNERNNEGDSY